MQHFGRVSFGEGGLQWSGGVTGSRACKPVIDEKNTYEYEQRPWWTWALPLVDATGHSTCRVTLPLFPFPGSPQAGHLLEMRRSSG